MIDLYIYDPYIFADSVEVLPSGPDEENELEIKEATEEGEEELDDTLIPDNNDLNHLTESTGTITYYTGLPSEGLKIRGCQ